MMTELSGMRLLIALLCVYLLSPIPARAVDQFEVFPLDNGERGIGTLLYGRSFAIDGDVVVGGAPNSTPPDFDACGGAYIHRRDAFGAWKQEAEIFPPDPEVGDFFGQTVAIEGNTAVVSAVKDVVGGVRTGSVFVYVRSGTTWVLQQAITPPSGADLDYFGFGLALRGDDLFIGAPGDDVLATNSGAVHIYKRVGNTWTWQSVLRTTAASSPEEDAFGVVIDVEGDTLAVGACRENTVGAVRTYEEVGGTWTFNQVVTRPGGGSISQFGATLGVSGDSLIVGGSDVLTHFEAAYPPVPTPAPTFTSTWVFTRSGGVWSEQQRLADSVAGGRFNSVSIEGDVAVFGRETTTQVFTRTAGVWSLEVDATTSNPSLQSTVGYAATIDGGRILCGTPTASIFSNSQGAKLIFEKSGGDWVKVGQVGKDNVAEDDWFGTSVAIDGNTVVVGAPGPVSGTSTIPGEAHVFTRVGATWVHAQKLVPNDGNPNDHFGVSVAIDGDMIVVFAGAGDSPTNFTWGAAYVYRFVGGVWALEAKLNTSETIGASTYGTHPLAISGDTIAIGYSRAGGTTSGAVFIFDRVSGVWSETTKLVPSDLVSGDFFGTSLALQGDTLVATSGLDGNPLSSGGSAYVFRRDAGIWTEDQKLIASNNVANLRFGNAVALDGDRLLISALEFNVPSTDARGAIYYFEQSANIWSEAQILRAPLDTADSRIGTWVALSGESAIATTQRSDTTPGQAAFQVFRLIGGTWIPVARITEPSVSGSGTTFSPVAVDDLAFVVGVGTSDANGTDSGEAYIYEYNLRSPTSDAWMLLE
jgi:hypothetical protein